MKVWLIIDERGFVQTTSIGGDEPLQPNGDRLPVGYSALLVDAERYVVMATEFRELK